MLIINKNSVGAFWRCPVPSSWRTLVKRVVKGLLMNERAFVTVSMRELKRTKLTSNHHKRRLIDLKLASLTAAEKDACRLIGG